MYLIHQFMLFASQKLRKTKLWEISFQMISRGIVSSVNYEIFVHLIYCLVIVVHMSSWIFARIQTGRNDDDVRSRLFTGSNFRFIYQLSKFLCISEGLRLMRWLLQGGFPLRFHRSGNVLRYWEIKWIIC